MNEETKSVVSVAEMASMVGLSRQRFYQLLGTTFPYPLYDVATRRPYYTEEMQQVCLEVRRSNCGINGKPVLFYCGYPPKDRKPKTKPKQAAKKRQHVDLIDGLQALGLPVRDDQVNSAVKQLSPGGIEGKNEAEVLREVFLFLKRQNSSDNVG